MDMKNNRSPTKEDFLKIRENTGTEPGFVLSGRNGAEKKIQKKYVRIDEAVQLYSMYLEIMRRKNINNCFNDNFGNIDITEMRKERAMKELAEKLKN